MMCSLLAVSCAAAPRPTTAGLVRSGTGFIVSPDGYAVTGAHVVSGCPTISLWPSAGAPELAQIIAADAAHDIALLRTDTAFPDATPLPPIGALVQGEPVFVLGYGVYVDRPRTPVTTRGVYLGTERSSSGSHVHIIRARWQSGDSGGPVLGANGSLVGMVIGRDADQPDLGVVLPGSEIAQFLNRQKVTIAGRGAPAASLQEELLAISLLVQCVPDRRQSGATETDIASRGRSQRPAR